MVIWLHLNGIFFFIYLIKTLIIIIENFKKKKKKRWDNVWLNEAFANTLMYFAMDDIKPEFKVASLIFYFFY